MRGALDPGQPADRGWLKDGFRRDPAERAPLLAGKACR